MTLSTENQERTLPCIQNTAFQIFFVFYMEEFHQEFWFLETFVSKKTDSKAASDIFCANENCSQILLKFDTKDFLGKWSSDSNFQKQ